MQGTFQYFLSLLYDVSFGFIGKYLPVPIAYWIRHPLREREVEGSILSVGDIGVRSDMAGW